MFRNEDVISRQNEMNATFIGSNNTIENEMNMNVGEGMMGQPMNYDGGMMGSMQRPICCPPQQRCIHRTICHEVPQECPFLIDQGK